MWVLLHDVISYWRDWFISPVLTSRDIVDDEQRYSFAFAGLLFGVLFMALYQVASVFTKGLSLGLLQLVVALGYVVFVFLMDIVFLQTLNSIIGGDLYVSDSVVIAGTASMTTIFSLALIIFDFVATDLKTWMVLPLTIFVHWVYILASVKGVSGKPWWALIMGAFFTSLLLLVAFYAGGQLYFVWGI